MAKRETKYRRAIREALRGDANRLHELLKHEKSTLGRAYCMISDVRDSIGPDGDVHPATRRAAIWGLTNALADLRQMVIEPEWRD